MQWTGQTGGTSWQQRALIALFRRIPVRVLYGAMSIWLLWYMIARRSATVAIYRYHRRRGRSRWHALWDTYHSYYCFGQAILDRFAVFAGCTYQVDVPRYATFTDLCDRSDGFIVLFSHLGNSEMAGYCLRATKRMNILAYSGETEIVEQQRTDSLRENNLWIIPIRPDSMDHLFAIDAALQCGEIVGMAADRTMQSKTIDCTFMGAPVHFPAGPFTICVTMRRPICLVFVLKTAWNRYTVEVQTLSPDTTLPRREQITDLARRYAAVLEQQTRLHPYQWFNFYDFWKQ